MRDDYNEPEPQISGQAILNIPKNVTPARAIPIEAFARLVAQDTVEALLKAQTDLTVGLGLWESEVQDSETARTRYSGLSKGKLLEIQFHRQLRLMKDLGGLDPWFMTINLTAKEDTDPKGPNGVLQSFFKRTGIKPVWTAVHVPARPGSQEQGHVHAMIALPRGINSMQRLVDFARERNSRQDRALGKAKARSVVTYAVYDARGLYRYFTGPKNLRRAGARVLASQSVRGYLRKASKSRAGRDFSRAG